MAIEDLLKKAVAAFNALSPEQQAEMMEEQRQSWVRGNVGLSRDERGMTSPVMPRPAPADLKARDRKRYKLIRKSLQNKGLLPAATDTGLDYYTAADVMWSLEGIDPVPSKNGQWVKRSQAEELLAAEIRRERDLAAKQISEVVDRMSDDYLALKAELDQAVSVIKDRSSEYEALEADNAALTARVKELSDLIDGENCADPDKIDALFRRAENAETQLEAARKALERFLEAYRIDYDLYGASIEARAALEDRP